MKLLTVPVYKVDAFTDRLFSGNPAAVCPLEYWLDKSLLQSIAAENNLSETAFLVKEGEGYGLKWFTPEVEIDLCGHATLASAFVLFNYLGQNGDLISFFTNSGKLTVSKQGETLTLNFPSIAVTRLAQAPAFKKALGKEPLEVWVAPKILMAVYENEDDVAGIEPDFEAIRLLDCSILYVTAPGNQSDFVSRVFAPSSGINEDPVTGSAHCCFTPYWSKLLGKKSLTAIQVSKRRGELFCEDLGDRVSMSGKAVLYLKGEIYLAL